MKDVVEEAEVRGRRRDDKFRRKKPGTKERETRRDHLIFAKQPRGESEILPILGSSFSFFFFSFFFFFFLAESREKYHAAKDTRTSGKLVCNDIIVTSYIN